AATARPVRPGSARSRVAAARRVPLTALPAHRRRARSRTRGACGGDPGAGRPLLPARATRGCRRPPAPGSPTLNPPSRARGLAPRRGTPCDRGRRAAAPLGDLGGRRAPVALLSALRDELRRASAPDRRSHPGFLAARACGVDARGRTADLAGGDDGAL